MIKCNDCKQIDETYVKDMITKLNSEYKLGYNIPFYTVNIDGNDEPFILSADFNTIFDDVLPSYRLSFMRNTVMTLDPSLSTEYAAGIITSTVNYILRKIDSYNYTEDSKMKKSEEIQNEIKKTQEQLANLQKALKEAEESETQVPDNLRFQTGETYYNMATTGAIVDGAYHDEDYTDHVSVLTRRLFKTREYAEMFTKKAQFIADCLHFKYLYDRDYKPDLNWFIPFENKYYIIYDYHVNKYIALSTSSFMNESTVYFSTKEIAEKCAAWLNARKD